MSWGPAQLSVRDIPFTADAPLRTICHRNKLRWVDFISFRPSWGDTLFCSINRAFKKYVPRSALDTAWIKFLFRGCHPTRTDVPARDRSFQPQGSHGNLPPTFHHHRHLHGERFRTSRDSRYNFSLTCNIFRMMYLT